MPSNNHSPDEEPARLSREQENIVRDYYPEVNEAGIKLTDDYWEELKAKESVLFKQNHFLDKNQSGINARARWIADPTDSSEPFRFDTVSYSALHAQERIPLFGLRNCMLALFSRRDLRSSEPAVAWIYEMNLHRRHPQMRVFPMILANMKPKSLLISNTPEISRFRDRAINLGHTLDPREADAQRVLTEFIRGAYGAKRL